MTGTFTTNRAHYLIKGNIIFKLKKLATTLHVLPIRASYVNAPQNKFVISKNKKSEMVLRISFKFFKS